MKYLIRSISDFKEKGINDFVFRINKAKKVRIGKMLGLASTRSIVGEMLLCELLRKEKIDYDNILIDMNDNGKPYINNCSIYYSISHDGDKVICAINNSPIGVDIIKTDRMKMNFVKYFCNLQELEYARNVIDYCKIFSLKEAYIKALGLTISSIQNVSVIDDNKISLHSDYYYDTFVYDEYVVSICYKKEKDLL